LLCSCATSRGRPDETSSAPERWERGGKGCPGWGRGVGAAAWRRLLGQSPWFIREAAHAPVWLGQEKRLLSPHLPGSHKVTGIRAAPPWSAESRAAPLSQPSPGVEGQLASATASPLPQLQLPAR